MKIILSRKGFDSSFGGMPSPIMPDGELISLPIPSKNDSITFSDISIGEQNLFQLIHDLNPRTKIKESYCLHLDPDLRGEWINRDPGWRPAFGQQNQSLSHLNNQKVGVGDLFLFFGWFRQTEISTNGQIRYIPRSPDLHVIFGYLEIGKQHRNMMAVPDYFRYHPHASYKKTSNCIYESSDKVGFDRRLPGAGTFRYDDSLVLTKKGLSRSKWDLPEFFKGVPITYHSDSSFKDGYFDSAKKGQEFVIQDNGHAQDWAVSIIQKGMSTEN